MSDQQSELTDESENSFSTTGTNKRFWLTNDLLAGVLVGSLVLVVLAHLITTFDISNTPQEIVYLYVFSVGSSVAWAFGKDAVEAWRGGGDG